MMMKPLPKAAQSWRELFADPKQAAALSQSTWQRWQNYQALSENLLIRQARLARDIWACAWRPGFDLTLWQQQSQLQKAVLDRVAAQQAEGARELLTILLGAGTLVCEHLTNLGALPDSGFRFTAVPPKVKGMGTFPVRAFAEIG